MAKKALIYGITGQDGSYLADLLLKRGYEIAGAANADASPNKKAKYFKVDLGGKEEEYIAPISEIAPDEVYYLAGISSHAAIAANPAFAFRVNAVAPIAIMESIEKNYPKARFFHASSAYIFEGREGRVDEKTYPKPIGPYGISKLCAHMMAIHFRKNGLFACNGILFNHESPVRPKEYVTRKITLAAAEIIKFCPAYFTLFLHFNFPDPGRDKRKNTFYADSARSHVTHSKHGIIATSFHRDNNSFKHLHAFPCLFFDFTLSFPCYFLMFDELVVHSDCIADVKINGFLRLSFSLDPCFLICHDTLFYQLSYISSTLCCVLSRKPAVVI